MLDFMNLYFLSSQSYMHPIPNPHPSSSSPLIDDFTYIDTDHPSTPSTPISFSPQPTPPASPHKIPTPPPPRKSTRKHIPLTWHSDYITNLSTTQPPHISNLAYTTIQPLFSSFLSTLTTTHCIFQSCHSASSLDYSHEH